MGDARDTAKKKKADEKKTTKGRRPGRQARRRSKAGCEADQEVRQIEARSA